MGTYTLPASVCGHQFMLVCVWSLSRVWFFVTPWTVPGSSVHGISQARILEWVDMPSSRGSSWPRDRTRVTWVSCIGRWVLYRWTTWGVHQSGSSSNLVQEFIEFNLYFLSTPSFPSQRLVGGTEISNLLITWSLRWQTLPTLRLSGLRSPQ